MAHPELTNIVYAHAIEANGRYWLWYFFALGTHEGDWEMVQLRLDEDGQPDVALYAQHRYGEERAWDEVEKLAGRPVVYVARGSHASYFEAGFHQTEAWYDLADGRRRMKDRPRLEILGDDDPAWPLWTGRWGDTLPRTGLESNSPTGPGAKKQWQRPDAMLDNPPQTSKHDGMAPKAPDVGIVRASGRLRVAYDVSKRDPRPTTLVVTVNSEDEPGVPPRTLNLDVNPTGHGEVTTDVVLDPPKHYDVHSSIAVGNPPKPSESLETRIAPFAAPEPTFVQRVLAGVSSTIATIRGDRRRAG